MLPPWFSLFLFFSFTPSSCASWPPLYWHTAGGQGSERGMERMNSLCTYETAHCTASCGLGTGFPVRSVQFLIESTVLCIFTACRWTIGPLWQGTNLSFFSLGFHLRVGAWRRKPLFIWVRRLNAALYCYVKNRKCYSVGGLEGVVVLCAVVLCAVVLCAVLCEDGNIGCNTHPLLMGGEG